MTRYGLGLTMLFLGALAVTASGCGRTAFTFYPVEGTVTKDGRPLRDIEVVFLADPDTGTVGPRASGRTDEAGHYRLRTDRGEDGVVAGKHVVLIIDLEAAKGQMLHHIRGPQRKEATQRFSPEIAKRLQDELKPAADAPRVPPSYGRINETPLRVEVRPEAQVIDLDVK
jgi:hypothetical protein